MQSAQRSWDIISQEQRNEYIKELIDFFMAERNEAIGVIAAENLLDHFLQTAGIQLYNAGVQDSVHLLKERYESTESDLEALLKSAPRRREIK